MAGVAALIHGLAVNLDRRLEAGEVLPTLPPRHVQENKWRAAKYGLEAEVILDAGNQERLVTDDLSGRCARAYRAVRPHDRDPLREGNSWATLGEIVLRGM